jgi:hypothetical protein
VAGVEIGDGGVASRPTVESASESEGAGVESEISDGGESIGDAWRIGSTGEAGDLLRSQFPATTRPHSGA